MENKPKKSKALIITLIVILFLLILGYLLIKNRDIFGVKTSNTIAKIFSPLLPSSNSKGVSITTKAGGDIKKGDEVSLVNPIVIKATGGTDVFGFALSDIKYNDKGEILINNNTLNIGGWKFNPGKGEWTLNPNKGEWVFNSNSGKWIAPQGIPSQPVGGWIYSSDTRKWTLSTTGGGWVYDSTARAWVSPETVPVPPTGGWVYDSNTKVWTLNPSGGEWLFNPNTRAWGSPGDENLFGNSLKIIAQAGEDLKKGDGVSLFNPTIIKTTAGSSVFGIANENISNEGSGRITIRNSGATNTFFDSFSRFLNNLFNVTPSKKACVNGAVNSPLCTIDSNNLCLNGANNPPNCTTVSRNLCLNETINPPLCTILVNGSCLNGTINPPLCTVGSDNKCINGTINPPLCTINSDNTCLNKANNPPLCDSILESECINGAINPPLCTIGSENKCVNGTINPPLCTITSDNKCINGTINPPICTVGSDNKCLNGATNPQLCTIGSDNKCLNGATNPQLCTIGSDNKCLNGATNPQLCTITSDNKCINGTINPPLCTITSDNKCLNGAINPEICNVGTDNKCINGTTNPPVCTTGPIDSNKCINGATNPPVCTTGPIDSNKCINGAINPPTCDDFGFGNKFPTVRVTASPSSVAPGASSTISWTSTNSTSCDAGTGRGSGTSGSFETGPLKDSNSYSVTCTGLNGSSNNSVYVFVTGGSNTFPTVKVTASPSSVALGASSTINWTSTNSTSCDAGTGRGTATAGSFETGPLTENTSYSVTCKGDLGSGAGFVNIFVSGFGETKYECNDKINNNDNDLLIDNADPECHVNGDLNKEYVAEHNSESTSPSGTEPDLTAGNVTPASSLINTQTTLSSTITNIGGGSTLKTFSSFFAITQSNPGTSSSSNSSSLVSLDVTIPIMSPKTSNTAKVSYKFTSAGTYYIRACADKKSAVDDGLITEVNENNNCGAWTTFTVTSSLPVPCLSPKITDTETKLCINKSDCKSPKIVIGDKCEVPGPCVSPMITDTETKACINKSDCKSPKIVIGDKCEVPGPCVSPMITDTETKACINKSDCKPPKVVNGDKCESGGANKCLLIEQNPLTFNDAEKAQLDILLRKFYLISSSLKTVEDISTIYNEIEQNTNFASQIDNLTKKCYLELNDNSGFNDFCSRNKDLCEANSGAEFAREANSNFVFNLGTNPYANGFTGIRHGNPWYTKGTNGSYPYKIADTDTDQFGYTEVGLLEPIYNASGRNVSCRVASGYFTGKTTDGIDCDTFNNFNIGNNEYSNCWAWGTGLKTGSEGGLPSNYYQNIDRGCKWVDSIDMNSTERILNIW